MKGKRGIFVKTATFFFIFSFNRGILFHFFTTYK